MVEAYANMFLSLSEDERRGLSNYVEQNSAQLMTEKIEGTVYENPGLINERIITLLTLRCSIISIFRISLVWITLRRVWGWKDCNWNPRRRFSKGSTRGGYRRGILFLSNIRKRPLTYS